MTETTWSEHRRLHELPDSHATGNTNGAKVTLERLPPPCAECRRRKLKCNRRFPCTPCSNHGRAGICPDGQLAPGATRDRRRLLAINRHLRERADSMQQRMDALQAAIDEVRPGYSREDSCNPANDVDTILARSVGTLRIGDDEPNFAGGSATSDFLIMEAPLGLAPTTASCESDITCMDLLAKQDFAVHHLKTYLPQRQLAERLVITFQQNVAWLVGGLVGVTLEQDILDIVYDGEPSATNISILFSLLAIGTQFSDTVDVIGSGMSNVAQSAWYCCRARAGLSVGNILSQPTLAAVRALHILTWAQHFLMLEYPASRRTVCTVQGLSAQLCRTLELHRDDTHLNLSDAERLERRSLFWDVVLCSSYVSLPHNHPPALFTWQIDVSLPAPDHEALLGEAEDSFAQWRYRYVRDSLLPTIHFAFGTRAISYATTLSFDARIRDMVKPSLLRVPVDAVGVPNGLGDDPIVAMMRAVALVFSNLLRIYLHRPFFALALADFTHDPLSLPWHESVVVTFRAALEIVSTMRIVPMTSPRSPSAKMPWLWSATFTASVVLAALAIRCPTCTLAGPAKNEFAMTVAKLEQFVEQAKEVGVRSVKGMLPSLRKLVEKAEIATSRAAGLSVSALPAVDLDAAEEAFIFGRSHIIRESPSSVSELSSAQSQNRESGTPSLNFPMEWEKDGFEADGWGWLCFDDVEYMPII